MTSTEFNAENRINKLEQRVEFLEEEVGTSLKEAEAEGLLNSLFPHSVETEFRGRSFEGYFIRGTGMSTDEFNKTTSNLEHAEIDFDIEWELIETGEGLGIEIWTV